MRFRLVMTLAAAATLAACGQSSQTAAPKTDEEKAIYSLGVILAKRASIADFQLTDQEMDLAKSGFADGARDKAKFSDEEIDKLIPKLQELHTARSEAAMKKEKEAGTAFLAKAAAESGAKKLDNGLVYKAVKEGTGAQPTANDTVKVNYEGKFVDGKVFDSTDKHPDKAPSEFPLAGMIPCWTEGVQQMKVGGKAHIVCPPELAYGDQAQPPMRAGATLVFEVELLDIVKPQATPAASPAPPAGGKPAAAPKGK
jgi:FKBP-type peptidyl-prolyl cis-trans isomerase FkpA